MPITSIVANCFWEGLRSIEQERFMLITSCISWEFVFCLRKVWFVQVRDTAYLQPWLVQSSNCSVYAHHRSCCKLEYLSCIFRQPWFKSGVSSLITGVYFYLRVNVYWCARTWGGFVFSNLQWWVTLQYFLPHILERLISFSRTRIWIHWMFLIVYYVFRIVHPNLYF